MEIAAITVEGAKGIQKIEMDAIKPINVLIGRNNSGKSSALASLRLLMHYFDTLKDRTAARLQEYKIPVEFFRKGGEQDQSLRIAVTVSQSIEERREQFLRAVSTWSTQHQGPHQKMDGHRVDLQLARLLFEEITFAFSAPRPDRQFGLESITTTSPDVPEGGKVIVASARSPGQALRGIDLSRLFVEAGVRDRYETVYELAKSQPSDNKIDIGVSTAGLESPHHTLNLSLLSPSFEFLRGSFSSISLLNAYRHGEDTVTPQKRETLAENGAGLVNFVHNLILNNHALFTEIAELVKHIVPEVGRLHARFTGKGDHTIELAYEWPDGRIVNLANMGGGVEQLVILGCLLLAQRTSCILWEEPESHLHPAAQDALLSQLESRVGTSLIFITTHSPVFVRPSDRIAVHAITNVDGKNAIGRTLLKEELQEACAILGSRPGHLAQADIVVYVEGKHGAAAIDEWLMKWPERNEVLGHLLLAIQPCNADEIGTDDFDMGTLRSLTPNMIMFVDKDSHEGSTEPKESRKKLAAMCKEHDIPCLITTPRQIEDYFSEEAVRSALPSNVNKGWTYDSTKPMGQQIKNGWKKYNRRIAEAISWSEIEGNADIAQLITEITRYAASLKP